MKYTLEFFRLFYKDIFDDALNTANLEIQAMMSVLSQFNKTCDKLNYLNKSKQLIINQLNIPINKILLQCFELYPKDSYKVLDNLTNCVKSFHVSDASLYIFHCSKLTPNKIIEFLDTINTGRQNYIYLDKTSVIFNAYQQYEKNIKDCETFLREHKKEYNLFKFFIRHSSKLYEQILLLTQIENEIQNTGCLTIIEQPVFMKNQNFNVNLKKGVKVDLIRVIVAMYDNGFFEGETKQKVDLINVMNTLGDVLGVDLSDYKNSLSTGFQSSIEKNLKVFEDLKQPIQKRYNKRMEK
jgi:hypothetical protein